MARNFTSLSLMAAVGLAALALRPGGAGGVRAADAPLATAYLLTVTPDVVTAGQRLGSPGDPALTFEFTAPSALRGGGLPSTLNTGWEGDRSVVQIELPMRSTLSSDTGNLSTGAG